MVGCGGRPGEVRVISYPAPDFASHPRGWTMREVWPEMGQAREPGEVRGSSLLPQTQPLSPNVAKINK